MSVAGSVSAWGANPMTRRPALSALLLALCWTASSAAQNAPVEQRGGLTPGPSRPAPRFPVRWWKDPAITTAVGLTDAQATRIDAVFEEFLKPQRARWAAFHPLETQLDELLRQPAPDEKQVVDLITRLEDRRSEMNRNRMIMLFHIQQVLSPAQRGRLEELGWSATPSAPPPAQRDRR